MPTNHWDGNNNATFLTDDIEVSGTLVKQSTDNNASNLATHIADTEGHRQFDTVANLTTWASTAPDGARAFSTDTKVNYTVVSNVLVADGGSVSVYKAVSIEGRKTSGLEGDPTSANSTHSVRLNTVSGPNPTLVTQVTSGGQTVGIDGTATEFIVNETGVFKFTGFNQAYRIGRCQLFLRRTNNTPTYVIEGNAGYVSNSSNPKSTVLQMSQFVDVTAGDTFVMILFAQEANGTGQGISGISGISPATYAMFGSLLVERVA